MCKPIALPCSTNLWQILRCRAPHGTAQGPSLNNLGGPIAAAAPGEWSHAKAPCHGIKACLVGRSHPKNMPTLYPGLPRFTNRPQHIPNMEKITCQQKMPTSSPALISPLRRRRSQPSVTSRLDPAGVRTHLSTKWPPQNFHNFEQSFLQQCLWTLDGSGVTMYHALVMCHDVSCRMWETNSASPSHICQGKTFPVLAIAMPYHGHSSKL